MSTMEITIVEKQEMQQKIDGFQAQMDEMMKCFQEQMTIREEEKKEAAKRMSEMQTINENLAARLGTVEREQQEDKKNHEKNLRNMQTQLNFLRQELQRAETTSANLREELCRVCNHYEALITGMGEENLRQMNELTETNEILRAERDRLMALVEGNEERNERTINNCNVIKWACLPVGVVGLAGAFFAGSGSLCTTAIAVAAVSFFSSFLAAVISWYLKDTKENTKRA